MIVLLGISNHNHMKNPHEDMTIYRLSDTKAHLGNISRGTVKTLITIVRSKGGNMYAFDGYNEKPVSKAGGYGYDKRATALQGAIEKITGVKLQENGASGERVVCAEAKTHGIIIEGLNGWGEWQECA